MSRQAVWRALTALWVLAIAAVSTPAPISSVPGWLDGSWLVGLDLASRRQFPVGSRLLFTYGPYGFLDNTIPFFIRQWLEAVTVTLAVHVALVACVAILLWRMRAGWPLVLLSSAVLLLGLHGSPPSTSKARCSPPCPACSGSARRRVEARPLALSCAAPPSPCCCWSKPAAWWWWPALFLF